MLTIVSNGGEALVKANCRLDTCGHLAMDVSKQVFEYLTIISSIRGTMGEQNGLEDIKFMTAIT